MQVHARGEGGGSWQPGNNGATPLVGQLLNRSIAILKAITCESIDGELKCSVGTFFCYLVRGGLFWLEGAS